MARLDPLHVVDVFVYTVVLGLFVEFFPRVISESFVFMLLTAVLLKGVLEVVRLVKKALLRRVRESGRVSRVVSAATLLLLLPGSKFLVLMATEFLFSGEVRLGGFWSVTVLIVSLMLARGGVRWLFASR